MRTDFIVITTKEGGIGIDFRGTETSHVILAFEYQNYSELVQALGRGSRDINKRSTGTLITKDNIKCPIEELLGIEERNDQVKAENL